MVNATLPLPLHCNPRNHIIFYIKLCNDKIWIVISLFSAVSESDVLLGPTYWIRCETLPRIPRVTQHTSQHYQHRELCRRQVILFKSATINLSTKY